MTLPVTFLLLLLTLPLLARGDDFIAAPGTTFSITDPAGLCRLDAGASTQAAELLAALEAADGETLVALATLFDCPFVDSLASGAAVRPAAWVRIVTATEKGEPVTLPLGRREYLRQLAQELRALIGEEPGPDFSHLIEQALQSVQQEMTSTAPDGIALSKVQPLGVLAEDPDGVYAGIVGVISLNGARTPVLTVLGATVLKGRPISVYLSRPYGGPESVPPQVEETRRFVADLVARNDPAGDSPGGGALFGWDRLALFTGIGAAAGITAALVLRRKRRSAR